MRKARLLAVGAVLTLVGCGGGGGDDGGGGTGPAVFTALNVTPTSVTVAPNGTQALTASAVDQRGQGMTGLVTQFSSSNQSTATVTNGGVVTGVIPRALLDLGVGDRGVTELLVTDGLRDRKAIMDERGDAFVALPGGLGTLDVAAEPEAMIGDARDHAVSFITQVSLLPPPCDEFTTSDPSRSATRVSPPGTSVTSLPERTNGRKSRWRGAMP